MLLVGALASSVKAADSTVPPPQPAPAGWLITAGADARAVPRYMGSNASAIVPVPYFDVRRPGSQEGFHTPRDGTGIALFDNGVLAIGPVGSLIWRRWESYSSSLKGLGNVNFTGLIGGFADYWAMPWLRSRVEVLGGFGGATGVMTNLSIDAVIPLSKALTWSGGPRALRHRRVGKPVFQHYARAIDRIRIAGIQRWLRLAGARRWYPAQVPVQPNVDDLRIR
jgi:MipA family protein